MQSYYNFTTHIRNYLNSHHGVRTIIIGNISDNDIAKQTLYPLAQMIIGDTTFANNTIKFSMSILIMDSVYTTKEGVDNKSDVYNSTLAVANGLQINLKRGRLYKEKYVLDGEPIATPFEDSFGNLLTGWRVDFTVVMPNTDVSTCAEYIIGERIGDTRIYTWDTTAITF